MGLFYKHSLPRAYNKSSELGSVFAHWCDGLLLRVALFKMHIRPWSIGLLVFAGYWGLPLIVATLSGSLVTKASLSSLCSLLPAPVSQNGILQWLMDFQSMPQGLAYLNDRSHFIFAALLVPGSAVVSMILTKVHTTVAGLQADGLPHNDRLLIRNIYNSYRAFANHWAFRLFSLLFACITAAVFLSFHYSVPHAQWWGNRLYGFDGILFSAIEAGMVYYGTQSILLVGCASAMLSKLLTGKLALRPFHPDGANGLAPVGRMIMLLWALALVLGAEICVALFLGYLGIERLPLSWVLALVGLSAIPVLAIIPLYVSLNAIQRARAEKIGRFEPVMNSILSQAEVLAREGRHDEAAKKLCILGDVHNVHNALVSLNVWPFNRHALAGAFAAYAVQLVLILNELLRR